MAGPNGVFASSIRCSRTEPTSRWAAHPTTISPGATTGSGTGSTTVRR